LALTGFLGVYLNQLLFAIGVFYAQSIIAAIMQLAVSPTTTALAIILKQEKFSFLKLIGIILCIIGSLVMIDISHFSLTSGTREILKFVFFSRLLTICWMIFHR
jgi:drug/metabolite transporter (DMT)-like permease